MRFFLLGFMGTGKTYWGKLWAAQHQLVFFDLDAEIERSEGLSIREIFEKFGETHFRQKEQQMLKNFANKNDFILSTGGGTPCFYDNMEWMNNNGVTIYLQTAPEILKERLAKEKSHRPLIQNLDDTELISFIENNINKRNKFYTQAKEILPTDTIGKTTFNEIVNRYV